MNFGIRNDKPRLRRKPTAWILLLLLSACIASAFAAPPLHRRVFVGTLVESIFRPSHSGTQELRPGSEHPPRSVRIDLRCAIAHTTYAVHLSDAKAPARIVADANIGEWCDMPAGMNGLPVLVEITRTPHGWSVRRAFGFELSHNGAAVLIPEGDPVVCGLRLWDLRSPADQGPAPYSTSQTMPAKQVRALMRLGVLRQDAQGALVYASEIRMQDVRRALDKLPCKLKASDIEPTPSRTRS